MLEQWAEAVNGVIWSNPVVYVCLGVGLLFSIMTRFLQIRHFREMIRLVFKGKSSEAGVSSFQAFTMALSGRVGTGNIAGIALAVGMGGPGAIFWMWVMAFIGSATAFVESTLAQVYKVKRDGQYRGGPAFYIEKGTGFKWFAVIFAVAALVAMCLLMPGTQSNSIAVAFHSSFGMDMKVSGIVVVVLLALIIFGGVKRIANVAQVVIPFMALGYILVSFYIMMTNITALPDVFSLIFRSAFGVDSVFGGMAGTAIAWGVKRGIYSNEAGQGSGAHPAAAAEVSHPAKQGLVQAFSVYVDTFLVCTSTAFMVLFTGMYNVKGPGGDFIVQHLPGVEEGTQYTQAAIESVFPGFGSSLLSITLFFFAFTTIIAYYYIAETNMAYLVADRKAKWPMFVLKLVILGSTFYGTVVKESALAWTLGDMGVGIMLWVNLIAMILLAKPALLVLKDYEQQRRQGLDPVFDPEKAGISNAEYWSKEYQPPSDELTITAKPSKLQA
ncbi:MULTISPECIES: alanine/glycine:cation symporter family protein [Paenibacillus]|uniref:Sodium:alanine symporter n=1 Tax=Paenibacillus polymyxa TaxID=1406 RepID=A0ABX2ZDX5_PAEPO|nr:MULTISPECIES: alanine/glycine:cation symporter family protein [Paenibacillus]ALA43791.1 sodium:alanine symporter [Paenibacillus peoriae]ODA06786.1 sodium:alanine symporter [Paenibacillus polymyxa]ODB59185.1 sodium:alanine symporter [Paenibacillus polymyxa]OME70822.1 sodium:alanine symporter [Paenibacillus peoriae]SFR22359.1 alanine or glycine:cation symporter, AGCS family [Paenibacillus sp. cl130]